MSKIELYNADCLDKMKDIPSGSVDLVLTDPPYGTTACKWDVIIPFEPMWTELERITKPNGTIILFSSQPFSSKLIMSNISLFKYEIIWDKTFSSNPFLLPCRVHENILIFYKNKGIYNPIYSDRPIEEQRPNSRGVGKVKINQYNNNVFGSTKKGHSDKFNDKKISPKSILKIHKHPSKLGLHPTQKPVEVFEYLIETYSNENQNILDFTMGSGSTGVACKNLNRNFIGIEKDESYFKIAKERIEKHTAQQFLGFGNG